MSAIGTFFRKFMAWESAGGVMLLCTAMAAFFFANSSWASSYFSFIQYRIVGVSILHGVNEGLMTLFFLLVGLELKREWTSGELSDPKRVLWPCLAALGGMLIPALTYLCLTPPAVHHGWGVSVATDIAFSLGVVTLLGKRVPKSLKLFLAVLAIADDLGSILVMGLFYVQGFRWEWGVVLVIGSVLIATLSAQVRRPSQRWALLFFAGILFWISAYFAGIHPSISGVILAFVLPSSVWSKRVESLLLPIVSFLIVPFFVFLNAGVSLTQVKDLSPVFWGVTAGLLLGKPLGIVGMSWVAQRQKWITLPQSVSRIQLIGIGFLAGIGFTMSLLIASVAFVSDSQLLMQAKLGIVCGSLIAALLGSVLLGFFPAQHDAGD